MGLDKEFLSVGQCYDDATYSFIFNMELWISSIREFR